MNLIFIRTPSQIDTETFGDSKLTVKMEGQNTMIKALQSLLKQERFKQRPEYNGSTLARGLI